MDDYRTTKQLFQDTNIVAKPRGIRGCAGEFSFSLSLLETEKTNFYSIADKYDNFSDNDLIYYLSV